MSGKQFLVLLLLFACYLLLGAAVFHYIEQAKEIAQHAQDRHDEELIYKILNDSINDSETMNDLIPKLEQYCGKSFNIDPDRADPFKWHFYNAVFFVITVVSTIGYGNLAPTTPLSRILMIFYALVGIPMNGILLKSLADYFAHFFLRARDKYKMHQHNGMSLAGSIMLYCSLGLFVFMLCPSFIFMYFERWTFDESLYYAFVSLTTIGFGDFVAGQKVNHKPEYIVYKVFLILWLLFGLGYLFMVLSFITDAMRSKRMAKLSQGIKHTQTKLWHGMVHEMPHLLRRVLNELYLLKVKPVYHDDDFSDLAEQPFARWSSCPDLFWLDEAYKSTSPYPVVVGLPGAGYRRASRVAAGRPRALSEVLPGRLLVRRRSETELGRIDRRATFADATVPEAGLDPAELLHEFMNALVNWGGAVSNDECYNTVHKTPGTALPNGGYQGFADSDILSSEWKEQGLGRGARQRAKSLAPFSAANDALAEARYGHGVHGLHDDLDDSATLPADEAGQDGAANNAEWTWSGTGASKRVHELIRARQHRRRSEAVIRKQQRQDRRLQELYDFHRLQELEEQRHLDKEARSKEKRRARTLSTGAAETGAAGSGLAAPKTSVGGLMQRLAIPQRLKDFARRRRSLQPGGTSDQDDQDADGYGDDAPYLGQRDQRRRSPSYDPSSGVSPLFFGGPFPDPYRTHTAGESLLGPGFDPSHGRRDSIFILLEEPEPQSRPRPEPCAGVARPFAPQRFRPRLLSAPAPQRFRPRLLSTPTPQRFRPRLPSTPESGRFRPRLLSTPEPQRFRPRLLSTPEPQRFRPRLLSTAPSQQRFRPRLLSTPEPQTLPDGRCPPAALQGFSRRLRSTLENTSLAEFLRVLQSVQRQQADVQATVPPQAPPTPSYGKTRKLGTAGLAHQPQEPQPNSIFKVFPGLLDTGKPEKRRLSLRPSSPPPGTTANGGPAPATPTGRRRMSFWPSFGSSAEPTPTPSPVALTSPTAARRRGSTARRLSTFLGAGTCTDPDPADGDAGDLGPAKVTKKRRFSIWPTLGVMGRGGGGADKEADEKPPSLPAGLGALEDGRGDADVYSISSTVPQITISYVSDAPPAPPVAPAPRETLRRQALRYNLPTIPAYVPGAVPGAVPPSGPQDAAVAARMRFPRTSQSGAAPSPSALRRPSRTPAPPAPLPGRRGPSVPSPLYTSAAAHRRRAFSESTRAGAAESNDNSDNADEDNASDTHSERL
ncbi:uncharacterized protein LOC117653210 [Thrips palmi]|uniref:Uncharacterized protein LOC117653210 n=1 Tax=Thrips palmi TaxID=161013 RepID=A0A6P9A971_THRPL|nr:uncharacterized protein LOC117653210 [Thrips palmi]